MHEGKQSGIDFRVCANYMVKRVGCEDRTTSAFGEMGKYIIIEHIVDKLECGGVD